MTVTSPDTEQLQQHAIAIERELSKVIVGYPDVLRGVLITLLAGGHALLEGAPGLGKTLLVRTLAQVLDLTYSRIQCTPDLMPSDMLGTNVLLATDTGERRFEFQAGPIFANLVLVDEVNRAAPKTQSALLEAMQEHTVTMGTRAYTLPRPFFVIATQNPIEMTGTYPLPEAQLDRFLFKLKVEFPSADNLTEILTRTTTTWEPTVEHVTDGDALIEMQRVARDLLIASHIMDYAARLVMATHPRLPGAPDAVRQYVRYGASPRAAQGLVVAAKMNAFLSGRLNVSFEDVRNVAASALRHRIILNVEAEVAGVEADTVVDTVLAHVAEER
ncbi:MAG: MoxR family ATPase [Chloroflexi bacterium]|nr:MoxR family ATPase [Chloroflexota bacterium]